LNHVYIYLLATIVIYIIITNNVYVKCGLVFGFKLDVMSYQRLWKVNLLWTICLHN